MVVLAVIAVIVGLTLPLLAQAKRSAYHSVSLSNLHQLGIAQGIYENNNNNYMAYGAPTLVTAGLVPKALVASTLDPYPAGETNAFISELASAYPVTFRQRFLNDLSPYKLTYFGWREARAGFDPSGAYRRCIAGQPGAGWVVDPTYYNRSPYPLIHDNTPIAMSAYVRLKNDGSVGFEHTRYHGNCTSAKDLSCAYSQYTDFADGDQTWFNSFFTKKGNCLESWSNP